MSRLSPSSAIATLGIDLGKNSFHLVGQDERGAIVLRIKLSRAQLIRFPGEGVGWDSRRSVLRVD
jgi:hypothetical protein